MQSAHFLALLSMFQKEIHACTGFFAFCLALCWPSLLSIMGRNSNGVTWN